MNNLDKITIVIPNHVCKATRILSYYKEFNFKIILVDSTIDKIDFSSKHKNLLHLKFSHDTLFKDKMASAFDAINTPYTVLCPDDDFVVPSAIETCIDFLEKNPSYGSAQGYYIDFNNQKKFKYAPIFEEVLDFHKSDDCPLDRIRNSTGPYFHTFYSVQRTNIAKDFFKKVHSQLTDHNLGEIANLIVTVFHGKHIVLPIFYYARDSYSRPARYNAIPISDIISDKKHETLYRNFLMIVSEYISENLSTNKNNIYDAVDDAMQIYYRECKKKQIKNGLTQSFLNRFKRFFKIRLPFLFKNEKHVFYRSELFKDWKKIEKTIKMHPDI